MKRIYPILLFILIFLLTGCASTAATPVYVPEGTERDAIIADTDTLIKNILTGIENKDTEIFSKDFSDDMLTAMPAADQEKLFSQLEVLGKSESIDLVNVQDITDNYAVRYKVTYPKKVLIYRIVVSKADTSKVTGLWLE